MQCYCIVSEPALRAHLKLMEDELNSPQAAEKEDKNCLNRGHWRDLQFQHGEKPLEQHLVQWSTAAFDSSDLKVNYIRTRSASSWMHMRVENYQNCTISHTNNLTYCSVHVRVSMWRTLLVCLVYRANTEDVRKKPKKAKGFKQFCTGDYMYY